MEYLPPLQQSHQFGNKPFLEAPAGFYLRGWRGARGGSWKRAGAELSRRVPDIHSWTSLINYWCLCRTHHVLADGSGGGETPRLHGFHPRFPSWEPKVLGASYFAFKLSSVASPCTTSCRMGSGIRALTADLGNEPILRWVAHVHELRLE